MGKLYEPAETVPGVQTASAMHTFSSVRLFIRDSGGSTALTKPFPAAGSPWSALPVLSVGVGSPIQVDVDSTGQFVAFVMGRDLGVWWTRGTGTTFIPWQKLGGTVRGFSSSSVGELPGGTDDSSAPQPEQEPPLGLVQ